LATWAIIFGAEHRLLPKISPKSGANPTTSSYNSGVVNFYNATGSLAPFENKNILFFFENRSSLHRKIGSRTNFGCFLSKYKLKY
jgi:hypothetical protein